MNASPVGVRILGVAATAACLVVAGLAAMPDAPAATAPGTCGVLFDDFDYTSNTDPALAGRWVVRGGAGHPGMAGATWDWAGVTFQPGEGGGRVLQLTASTDGTPANTKQAQFHSARARYREGTYASRIRFAPAPRAGGTGTDHVVQTFYAQMADGDSPGHSNRDPNYSEIDFVESLPNGGWGQTTAKTYQTSWHTYQKEPWFADNVSTQQDTKLDGWHDVVAQVYRDASAAAGTDPYKIVFYLDGQKVGEHASGDKPQGHYFPRTDMTINWNMWFAENTPAHAGTVNVYDQQVDHVLFADGVHTPEAMKAAAQAYAQGGQAFVDTVAAPAGCPAALSAAAPAPPAAVPGPAPTATATATATVMSTVTQTLTVTVVAPAPAAWAPGTTYAAGDLVTHQGRTWRCRTGHASLTTWEPGPYTAALWTGVPAA